MFYLIMIVKHDETNYYLLNRNDFDTIFGIFDTITGTRNFNYIQGIFTTLSSLDDKDSYHCL